MSGRSFADFPPLPSQQTHERRRRQRSAERDDEYEDEKRRDIHGVDNDETFDRTNQFDAWETMRATLGRQDDGTLGRTHGYPSPLRHRREYARADAITKFRRDANTALNNIRSKTTADFEELLERGKDFHVNLQEIDSLEQVVKRLKWDDMAKLMRPNPETQGQNQTLNDIEKFIEKGKAINVPETNPDMAFFREHADILKDRRERRYLAGRSRGRPATEPMPLTADETTLSNHLRRIMPESTMDVCGNGQAPSESQERALLRRALASRGTLNSTSSGKGRPSSQDTAPRTS